MNQEKNKKAKDQVVEMTVVRPNAAGIDVGSTFHVIAVPPGRDEPRVRTFGTTTSDLQKAVDWLKKCAIDSVGMESTGVYLKGIFTALIQNGFEASLVNATQVRNVSGRKNDEDDAMWGEPGKFDAALQNATTSGKPVLIKVNYDNGHFTEDKSVTFADFADMVAFAMWQCGDKNFQSK